MTALEDARVASYRAAYLAKARHYAAEPAPAELNERWYIPCGCDHHGDHLGCTVQCLSFSGCRHVTGVDYSAATEAEADAHQHSIRCSVRQGPLGSG